MNIYKTMYYRLFNRVTDVIYNTDKTKYELIEELKLAQLETEEMFMSFEGDENSNEI